MFELVLAWETKNQPNVSEEQNISRDIMRPPESTRSLKISNLYFQKQIQILEMKEI